MKWTPGAVYGYLDHLIWSTPSEPRPPVQALVARFTRLVIVLTRDLAHGQLTLRAMGLVYTTLLSIVPLLAISFSVLKAFGVYNQIRPMLLNFLAPLGEKGVEITERIMQFIQSINSGVLGSVGLALLLYTAVSLVHKVEESCNYIWHVGRGRSIGERFSRYLSALLVGPLLVFSAIGISAAVVGLDVVHDAMQIEAIGWVAYQAGRLLPYALVIGAFTFVYMFIPNTKVRIGPALAGGVVGGIVWQSAGWAFARFAASSTNYSAIYSSFAILILFMLWLYLNWLILLFGSSVAFYVQHPEYLVRKGGELRLSNRMREHLALVMMSLIGRHHMDGAAPWTTEALARELRMPRRSVDEVLLALQSRNILTTSGEEPPGWLPLRDLDKVSAKELLDTVRAAGEDQYMCPDLLPDSDAVRQLMRRCDEATEAALLEVSVKDLVWKLPERPRLTEP
jgi:membrane protein